MSQVFASHDTKYVILLKMLLHFNLDLGSIREYLMYLVLSNNSNFSYGLFSLNLEGKTTLSNKVKAVSTETNSLSSQIKLKFS